LKALKLRIYPNKSQQDYINNLIGSYRFVYNKCLDKKIKAYTINKQSLGLKELGNYFHHELTKNPEYNFLNEHNTKVLKQSVITLLDSYKRFFVNGNGFPKFKSRKDNKQSCTFPLQAISKTNTFDNKITLNKQLKNLKFKTSDKYIIYLKIYKDNIRSATLSKTKSGNYFLSILIDLPKETYKIIPKPINNIIGIDLGIKDFIVDSDGNRYENIKTIRNKQKKISKLQRRLSKKQNGSNNKNKCRIKLAKYHEKLNNKKQYYLHEISNKLINENQVICMEDLNVSGMLKNHNLAKSIQELSLHKFKTMLQYKSLWYGRDIVQIDRYYPSSKLCNCCKTKNNNLTLSDREWVCDECGVVHDRDINAAINIRNEGQRLYEEKIGCSTTEFTSTEISGYTVDEVERVDMGNNFP
jgi:putative transposase